jgi:two-component system sensor histidine kinase UhpB
MKATRSSSIKLAAIFLLFGIAWVFISNISFYRAEALYKELTFVLLATLLVYFVSVRLISATEKANKEQEEALKRFNILGMATKDAVWDFNIITRECYTNRNLQEMFGYSPEELQDNFTWWTNNLHPDDKERVITPLDNMLVHGGNVWQDEYRFRCRNGEYKVIYDRGFILRDKEGAPYRLIGAMQDVSVLRMLQQRLKDEELRHKIEMTQNIMQAEEAERKKLGEELHDNITQLLGVVKLYIQQAISYPNLKPDLLSESIQYLEQSIDEIRHLSRSLLPPGLNASGLIGSLQKMVFSIRQVKNIGIELHARQFNEAILSDNKRLMIYRIIQEQLHNIIKHSGASQVLIHLAQMGNVVRLTVVDNGIGFEPQQSMDGMGLNNIRNRLEVFNGSMFIHSAPGKGCELAVEFEV